MQSKQLSKSLLQHHSSKASILWLSPFFTVQLSHPYMTTWLDIALTRRTFVGKVMSLLLRLGWGVRILGQASLSWCHWSRGLNEVRAQPMCSRSISSWGQSPIRSWANTKQWESRLYNLSWKIFWYWLGQKVHSVLNKKTFSPKTLFK